MTTLEKIESLMIPEEKAREIATGFGDTIIQIAIKHEGDDVNECVSVHGCFPAILSGIHTALDAMSERCGIPASELAKTIAMAAEMGKAMNRNRKLSKTLAHIADRRRRASGRREVVRRKWRRKWLEIWKVLTSQAFWLDIALSVLATGIPVTLMLFMMWWSFYR